MNPQEIQSRSNRPSPQALSQIIARFCDRAGPARSLAGFLLRGCRATAHLPGAAGETFEIDIRTLGFSEIQFTGPGPLNDGTNLEITFSCVGMQPQRWRCQVVRAESCAGGARHVVARFARHRPEPADALQAGTFAHI